MHSGSILLDVIEWMLILALIASGILIQPFAGEGRGEQHPGRRRRYHFYTSVLFTALCVCKLLEPAYRWQFMWGIMAFACLVKVLWSFDGRRLRRHFRPRSVSLNLPAQS
jgi:hypothetical protein